MKINIFDTLGGSLSGEKESLQKFAKIYEVFYFFLQVSYKWIPLSFAFPAGMDISQMRLIQRLRDISKRADLQISETSPGRLIKDVSSETSLRSPRFSQRRLWVAPETVILGLQTKALFI